MLMLLTAGCHHRQNIAYYPPPPSVDYGESAHARRPESRPAAPPLSAEPDDLTAKPSFTEVGMASWYGPNYHQHAAADGTVYDQNGLSAAHRELPLGSTVRVTNLATGQSIVVRITDRGPFVPGRILDLSMGAAKAIGVYRAGVVRVKVEAWAHHTADPAGKWCVQIGAFKNQAQALDLKADLMDEYPQARVMEFTGPTGHWVRIDPITPDHFHANEIAKNLSSEDPAALPYVVRLD